VVTFEPHSALRARSDHCPQNLTTLDEKTWLLTTSSALDHLLVIPFHAARWRRQSPAPTSCVAEPCGCNSAPLVGGDALRFRRAAAGGDHTFWRQLATRQGLRLDVVPSAGSARRPDQQLAHSAAALARSACGAASQLLGRDYFLRLVVGAGGAQRGKGLGFPRPTVKITPNKLLPANGGVRRAGLDLEGSEYQGALNLGFRPHLSGHA